MEFLIQCNLMNEKTLQQVQSAVAKYPHKYISVMPFSHEIVSNEPVEGNEYIPYGSTLMTRLSKELGWVGSSFDLDKFNYDEYLNHPDMLNSNVITVREAIDFLRTQDDDKLWFTRPSYDLKQYSGTVLSSKEIAEWFEDAVKYDSSNTYAMEYDTRVVLCEPVNIYAEWRYFIVNRKIVSGSMYRFKGQMHHERVLEVDVLNEAQEIADKWLPHDNCVMDLALVGEFNNPKVIEFNCINSSGFYDNDVAKIIDALWEYYTAVTPRATNAE